MAKKVQVTSVTPKSKVEKVSKEQQDRTRKLVGTIAAAAIPTGKAASTVAKVVARGKATKLTSGPAITKTKSFTQGKNAKVVESGPKATKMGERSPLKGTKVTVEYKTKKISPAQQAWQATGMKTTTKAGKAASFAKGAATATGASSYKKAADKKKK